MGDADAAKKEEKLEQTNDSATDEWMNGGGLREIEYSMYLVHWNHRQRRRADEEQGR